MEKVRHLIEPLDFTTAELEALFSLADKIIENPRKYAHECDGKILVTLFYEPSTRTRFSFEAAMIRLGGNVVGFSDPDSSSVTKGENVPDTIRIVSGYADVAVVRHPVEGAPKAASLYSRIPVINAGDGGHQHPTQTLTDLSTIRAKYGRLDNLKIGICGDLKNGRTTHSLVDAMSRYENNSFVFISPDELKMPEYICDELKQKGQEYKEVRTIEEGISDVDVLYMTRVQRERFSDLDEYERVKDSCILTPQKMTLAKKEMIILHPLPRVNEIHPDIDIDSRAYYFIQAERGMYIRMSLLLHLLNITGDFYNEGSRVEKDVKIAVKDSEKCYNPKCITAQETFLKHRYLEHKNGVKTCDYCGRVVDSNK